MGWRFGPTFEQSAVGFGQSTVDQRIELEGSIAEGKTLGFETSGCTPAGSSEPRVAKPNQRFARGTARLGQSFVAKVEQMELGIGRTFG